MNRFILGPLALIVATPLYLALTGPKAASAVPSTEPVTAPTAAASPSRTRTPRPWRACRVQAGETFDYDFDVAIDVSYDATALIGAPMGPVDRTQRGQYRLRGSWSWRVLTAPSGEEPAVVAAALSGLQIDASDLRAADLGTDVLEAPFLFKLTADCRFVEFAAPVSQAATDSLRVRRTMQLFEFALLEGAPARWLSSHVDELGEYSASYERSLDNVTRRRLAYAPDSKVGTATWDSHQTEVTPRVEDSAVVATVQPDRPWITRLEGVEQTAGVSGGRTALRTRTKLLLTTATGRPSLDTAALDLDPAAWTWTAASAEVALESDPAPVDTRTANMAVDDLLAMYTTLASSGDAQDFERALRLLTEYLQAHPEFAFDLLARMEAGTLAPAIEAQVFLALQKAGGVEAQTVLTKAITSQKLAELNRQRAVVALSDVRHPTPDAIETLIDASKRLSGDVSAAVANASTLALGALEGRTQDPVAPAIAERIRFELENRLQTQSSGTELLDALDAVGNSGNSTLLSALEPHLTSGTEQVRLRAIDAMRRMETAQTAHHFEPLLGDESPQVRRATVVAFSSQARRSEQGVPESVILAAVKRLPIEPAVAVRGALIELLGLASGTNPQARLALVGHFPNEVDPALLVLIGKFVQAFEL